MSKPAKICLNCVHCYADFGHYPESGAAFIRAYRCSVQVWDYVSGKLGDPDCHFARWNETLCGPSGKWFEPKL